MQVPLPQSWGGGFQIRALRAAAPLVLLHLLLSLSCTYPAIGPPARWCLCPLMFRTPGVPKCIKGHRHTRGRGAFAWPLCQVGQPDSLHPHALVTLWKSPPAAPPEASQIWQGLHMAASHTPGHCLIPVRSPPPTREGI